MGGEVGRGCGAGGLASGVGRMGEVVRLGAGAWCRLVEREGWWFTVQINILQALSRSDDSQLDI